MKFKKLAKVTLIVIGKVPKFHHLMKHSERYRPIKLQMADFRLSHADEIFHPDS